MENINKFRVFLEIKTEDEKLTDKWGEDFYIELERDLYKGDVIHLFDYTGFSDVLERDFKTLYFRIIERICVVSNDSELDDTVLYRYLLKPITDEEELKFIK